MEEEIAELRGDAVAGELFGDSIAANVDTLLKALRHHIELERAEAPAALSRTSQPPGQFVGARNSLIMAPHLVCRNLTAPPRAGLFLRPDDLTIRAPDCKLTACRTEARRQ